jgi:hypothetical protein
VPAVGSSPVSAGSFAQTVYVLANMRLLVFVVVAFPPPPVTTPANEAQLALNDYAPSEADQVLEARPVFIRALRKSFFNPSLASLSASMRGVNSSREIRLRPPSNGASPHRSPLPTPVAFP